MVKTIYMVSPGSKSLMFFISTSALHTVCTQHFFWISTSKQKKQWDSLQSLSSLLLSRLLPSPWQSQQRSLMEQSKEILFLARRKVQALQTVRLELKRTHITEVARQAKDAEEAVNKVNRWPFSGFAIVSNKAFRKFPGSWPLFLMSGNTLWTLSATSTGNQYSLTVYYLHISEEFDWGFWHFEIGFLGKMQTPSWLAKLAFEPTSSHSFMSMMSNNCPHNRVSNSYIFLPRHRSGQPASPL